MRSVLVCLAACAITLAAFPATAEEIKEIRVERSSYPGTPPVKTSPATVEFLARLDVGDDWSPEMIEQVKSRLDSSGLFRDVNVFSEPMEGGVRVYLQVEDKHSWIVAPAFYNQPTNTGFGVGYGENNLFGQNQKLLVYGQIATGDSFFIAAWVIPSIADTRFYAQLDTFLKSSRNIEYASPTKFLDNPVPVRESRIHYLNAGLKLGVDIYRGIKFDARLRGAKVSYLDVKLLETATTENSGIDCTMIDCSVEANIPAPGAEGNDISEEFTLSVDRRANYNGVQSGYRYAASFETSAETLGSDYRYYVASASTFNAKKLLERHNVILRTSFQYGERLPFQQELKSGGTTLRGYVNDQFRGNMRGLVNLEYGFPLFTVSLPKLGPLSIRGLGFVDSTYTTFTKVSDNLDKRNYLPGVLSGENDRLAPFKNAVGGGIRLYLQNIVLPLLGLDFGYGLESRDYQIYLAIGLTD